jgi:hypothetical protein
LGFFKGQTYEMVNIIRICVRDIGNTGQFSGQHWNGGSYESHIRGWMLLVHAAAV